MIVLSVLIGWVILSVPAGLIAGRILHFNLEE
jgi:hypothetical protein